MARRKLAGKDRKIIQGHRRDAFFKAMRRKGGVPRMPTAAPEAASSESEVQGTPPSNEADSHLAPEGDTAEAGSGDAASR
jgi:hypothetical protein